MNAQDLKNSILQLAIQGKLVKQRTEEGTAKELLLQIEAAKEQLIKDKKIKKQKPLPEITPDEIPFDIPESWEWVRLGEVTHNWGQKKPESTFNYIDVGSIDNINGTLGENENLLQAKDAPSRARKIVKQGSVIYSTVRPYLLNISVIDKQFEHEPIASTAFAVLHPFKGVSEKYLYQTLRSPMFISFVNSVMIGVAYPAINDSKLLNGIIPLPPLEEQMRIIKKIEELMPYVEKYNTAYSEVIKLNKKFPEDMQKSILQYAIQGKLVEQREEEGTAEELYEQIQEEKKKLIKEGKIKNIKTLPEITQDEIPFEIPKNWKWVSINDVAFVTKLAGFEYTKYLSTAIQPTGEIPIVRAKNIKPNNFIENENEFITRELSEKLSRCALDTRCILMTFIGAGIGEVAIFENKQRNHLAPNVAKIVPHIDMNDYLLYYFMAYTGQKEIFKYMKKTAQPSLSMETIRKVIIPLPPLPEQKRIVEKIQELLPHAKQLIKKLD